MIPAVKWLQTHVLHCKAIRTGLRKETTKICNTVYAQTPDSILKFDIVVGLAWSNDPESYIGSSIVIGRASHARQVKSDDHDKKGYPGPPVWDLGLGLTTPPHKKYVSLRSF